MITVELKKILDKHPNSFRIVRMFGSNILEYNIQVSLQKVSDVELEKFYSMCYNSGIYYIHSSNSRDMYQKILMHNGNYCLRTLLSESMLEFTIKRDKMKKLREILTNDVWF